MRTAEAKNLKLLFAAGLFVLLTAAKLLFPEATAPAREALRGAISSDADYMAVFRAVGDGLAADEEVAAAFLRLAGRGGAPEGPEYYDAEAVSVIRERGEALLPKGGPAEEGAEAPPDDGPAGSPEPTQAPPEEVPPAVAAFLEAQEPFAEYGVPANVSYAYPELPFEYVSPVDDMTSSGFGYRMHPLRDEVLFHYGTDFAAWTGTEILAFASGTVGMVGWDAGFGNYIIVQHSGGWRTLYAHCSAVYVTGGDAVEAGQCIGLVGATGNVTGPHLHLELTCDGVYYNPEFYLS